MIYLVDQEPDKIHYLEMGTLVITTRADGVKLRGIDLL